MTHHRFEQEYGDLPASAVAIARRPSRTYARGRVCIEDECPTILSIYNPNAWCHVHMPFRNLSGGPTRGRPRQWVA